MFGMTVSNFILTMSVSMLIMGLISILTGVIILVTKVAGKDVRAIADQTMRMAQKGIAEDVAGLVGNASALIDALNNLVKSVTGVGAFLILMGFVMLAGAYGLVIQLR
jgi:hypothetical protein